ncbi:23S RNA-specific pseudouridylate synthase [Bifidobacterium cuniculi]|uniref:RNA pseudouridylate synthase n=1 Tax=Bifidobacterium cuniculi TaxID=1688 RepID=A0A087AL20_9BIFI|nr:23S RNA-specific pseudouridylate synthase [Bifidobacterium cuniculi]
MTGSQAHAARHRWVTEEPDIPFDLPVVYEDSRIIVVDKPHFLATTPRGMWYRQSALIRLRERYGEPQITPAHRLDRLTAGIVVFVRDPAARGAYQMMFQERRVRKTYECVAPARPVTRPRTGTTVRLAPPRPFPLLRASHIDKQRAVLQAREIPGTPNARTRIDRAELRVEASARLGAPMCRYVLEPVTGKTHQLRVHMAGLGLPIMGDDLYPTVREPDYADFSDPLQLVARTLCFTDPLTGEPRRFVSRVPLA